MAKQLSATSMDKWLGLHVDNVEHNGPFKAQAMLNADVSRGDVRARPGTHTANQSTLSSTGYNAIYASPLNGGEFVLIRRDGAADIQVDTMSPAGVMTNRGTIALAGSWDVRSFASIGTTAGSFVYITLRDASTGYTVVKYSGAAVTNGTGKPWYVAVSAKSNRLIQGGYFVAADGPGGAGGSPSTVFFSEPGAPDTYLATSNNILQPGDGEAITGIVTWQDKTFVFKQSSMFVFYDELTQDNGLTEFAYRRVGLPSPLQFDGTVANGSGHAPNIVVGEAGVYYSTYNGIYLTTGGPPKRISDPIATVFSRDGTDQAMVIASGTISPQLSYTGRWLFAFFINTGFDGPTLVLDTISGEWMFWQLPHEPIWLAPAAVPTSLGAAFSDEFYFATPSDNNVYLGSRTFETDDGNVAIPWSYTSGYYDLGSGKMKRLRAIDLYGVGTVNVQMLARGDRPAAPVDAGGNLLLGVLPTIKRARRTFGVRGRMFAHKLSGTGTSLIAERVTRLEHRFAVSDIV